MEHLKTATSCSLVDYFFWLIKQLSWKYAWQTDEVSEKLCNEKQLLYPNELRRYVPVAYLNDYIFRRCTFNAAAVRITFLNHFYYVSRIRVESPQTIMSKCISHRFLIVAFGFWSSFNLNNFRLTGYESHRTSGAVEIFRSVYKLPFLLFWTLNHYNALCKHPIFHKNMDIVHLTLFKFAMELKYN